MRLSLLVLLAIAAPLSAQTSSPAPADSRPTQVNPLQPPVCPNLRNAPHPTPVQVAEIRAHAAADSTILLSAEPVPNIATIRWQIADYADCKGENGCYWADLDAQYNRAQAALDKVLATRKQGEKLAVVLDIDETALSSYCEEKREDFGFVGNMFNTWIVSPEASLPIPGALRFVQKAQAAGISVFFLTGRPEPQREATARNLETAGYRGWKELFLREPGKYPSTIAYKSAQRQKIVDQGYRIVVNIGDQFSDLTGTPQGEIGIKLPYPFYFLP